jgi:DNA-binding response OmpR family regulator
MRLLLVEDDRVLAAALSRALRAEGFVVDHLDAGKAAVEAVAVSAPDLLVLDLGLPDMDGTRVLQQVRKSQPRLPVLVLTARDGVSDKVSALDTGADDYLCKPFEMDELLARLRVLARHIGTSASSQVKIREVCLELASHEVSVDDLPVTLSRREYMLLKALMENMGRVLTREALENKLYGWGELVASNTIEVHISNLRKKMPEGFIRTVRGVGYTISKDSKS